MKSVTAPRSPGAQRSSAAPALLAVLLSLAVLIPSNVAASPRPLPFSYPYETLPAGKLEIEQYADLVPMRVALEEPDGTLTGVWAMRSLLQTELEFGLTDRLEVGWYFAFRQSATAGTPSLRFQGVKQRARLRLAEAGEWPVDVGLYLEVAEFHDEIEVEEKILLARRFGALNVVANLWVEQEYYFQTGEVKHIFNPTAGASYELSPKLMVGAEYWARGRFDRDMSTETSPGTMTSDAPLRTHHYLGPTLLAQQGSVFFSLGAYVRLDGIAKSAQVDDPYGKLWLRTLIGIEL